ncbi:hypothetical protein, partial [Burkholderia mallei]|uniref:hypothetical protein n=1 Tax=Burkholderia mallei TaxID=13373 RepID=UPI0023618948
MPTVSFGHPPFYFFVHGRDDVRVEASARRQRARRGNRHRRDRARMRGASAHGGRAVSHAKRALQQSRTSKVPPDRRREPARR